MSLYTCNDGHREICYEWPKCPACDVLSEYRELEETNESLRDQINDLRGELVDARAEIEELESKIP